MKIYKGTLVKKICIVSAFFGECQLKVLIVKKKYVWGVRIYFDWGDVSKGEKMVLCKFPPQI